MTRRFAEAALWSAASGFVAAAAVIGLLYSNLDSVSVGDTVRSLLVAVTLSVLGTLLCAVFHMPLARAFPVFTYVFFSYHGVRAYLAGIPQAALLSFGVVLVAIVAAYVLLRRVEGLKPAVYAVAATGAMVATMAGLAAPGLSHDPPPPVDGTFARDSLAAVSGPAVERADLPDIIYVVPDRYPSAATLAAEYGFDNTQFYESLRRRGFVVNESAWANYPKTFQSMASTLNSGYLGSFTSTYGTRSSDKRPVYRTLEENVVQDRLRRAGYRFLNYGNWWEPTRNNKWAQENYQGYPPYSFENLSEFERALVLKTPVREIVGLFTDAEIKRECRRIQRKLERLAQLGNGPEPVFVLAHMSIPHDPITMDAAGNCLDVPLLYPNPGNVDWDGYKSGFVHYLRYFNTAVLQIIDAQLSRRQGSGRELVFIIQSDEGPFPKKLREIEPNQDFTEFSRREMAMKMGIINSVRLPSGGAEIIETLQTPINNWRIVFNSVFGSRMDLLPDRIFIYPTEDSLYRFCDITAELTDPRIAYKPCGE